MDGAIVTHIWDGQNIAAEYNANGGMRARYLWGINLIAQQIDSNLYFYCFNAHGDVVQRTDYSGGVLNSYEYDAFGNEGNLDKQTVNPFRFCGEYFDSESGSLYLRARYYHMRCGRFASEDTVELITRKFPNEQEVIDPLSLNRYTYCHNNPLLYLDCSGHFILSALAITVGIGALTGLIVGGGVNILAQAFNKGWDNINPWEVAINAGAGLITGALSGTAAPIGAIIGINAAVGGAAYVGTRLVNNQSIPIGGLATSMALSGLAGRLGGNSANTINTLANDRMWIEISKAAGMTWGAQISANALVSHAARSAIGGLWRTALGNAVTNFVPGLIDRFTDFQSANTLASLSTYQTVPGAYVPSSTNYNWLSHMPQQPWNRHQYLTRRYKYGYQFN